MHIFCEKRNREGIANSKGVYYYCRRCGGSSAGQLALLLALPVPMRNAREIAPELCSGLTVAYIYVVRRRIGRDPRRGAGEGCKSYAVAPGGFISSIFTALTKRIFRCHGCDSRGGAPRVRSPSMRKVKKKKKTNKNYPM